MSVEEKLDMLFEQIDRTVKDLSLDEYGEFLSGLENDVQTRIEAQQGDLLRRDGDRANKS